MITPSPIPSSANHGPNADLSSDEGYKEDLEDSKDEPVTKKRVSDFDKEGEHETEAMGICLLFLKDLLFLFFPSSPIINL